MRRLGLAVLALALFGGAASARDRQDLKVRYETREGPSPWQPTTVTFLTGIELDTLTNTVNYNQLSTYGVIFFAQGQAAVIELQGSWCSIKADVSCAWGLNTPYISFLTGRDQGGRQWEFCAPSNFSCRD